MKMRSIRLASLGLLVGAASMYSASAAKADVLYGLSADTSNPPVLYSINTTTGVATSVATLTPSAQVQKTNEPVGLGSLGGTSLYAINIQNSGGDFTFGSVVNATGFAGQYTTLKDLGSASYSGLTANATSSAFYAIDNGTGHLKTVTPDNTGVVDTVGFTQTSLAALAGSVTFSGLAFDGSNTIYAVGNNDLYSINLTTGGVTDNGQLNVTVGPDVGYVLTDSSIYGLTFSGGTLYLNAGNPGGVGDSALFTVNSTSAASLTELGSGLGNNGTTDADGIGAIAFSTPVPEPSTVALAGLAIPALGWLVMKRRKATKVVPATIA